MTFSTKMKAAALALAIAVAGTSFMKPAAAAVPGINGVANSTGTGQIFNLSASADLISQPDGAMIYSWGYGCSSGSATPGFLPSGAGSIPGANCPLMQLPGPTLIVTEGQTVTVNLSNNLPVAAGNTSIVFEGFPLCAVTPATAATTTTAAVPAACAVTATGGVAGLLTQEAAHGTTVTYSFTADKPGTYAYHSGSQADLQVEMGLYGALIVLPKTPASCTSNNSGTNYSLASSAYDHPGTCYDREYLFQFSEMNSTIHQQAEAQAGGPGPILVTTEPYHPNYFLINGRSMPDDMDGPYSPAYAHQPYNGNPHMHPGELMLMRVIGQGRWQHPFHFHGNHARVLANDGNLLLAQNDPQQHLAGPLKFTIGTVPGQTVDAVFTWTGQGLNWDVYGLTNPHTCNTKALSTTPGDPAVQSAGFDPVTHEYCPDHGKPIPVTPPDPQIVANGLWYGGTPYLGLQAASLTPLPPGQIRQNFDAGYAYMWHSHNEREITTSDVFPGGMMMMMIIDPPTSPIDETL